MYTVHCTLYTVHCTLYTVHRALCRTHDCALYTVHCTLHRKIEVRWRYYSTEDKEKRTPVWIWCWCDVIKVADGISDRASKQSNGKVLDAGALYVRWPEDKEYKEKESYMWLTLLKNKWNKNVNYGWRCAAV